MSEDSDQVASDKSSQSNFVQLHILISNSSKDRFLSIHFKVNKRILFYYCGEYNRPEKTSTILDFRKNGNQENNTKLRFFHIFIKFQLRYVIIQKQVVNIRIAKYLVTMISPTDTEVNVFQLGDIIRGNVTYGWCESRFLLH